MPNFAPLMSAGSQAEIEEIVDGIMVDHAIGHPLELSEVLVKQNNGSLPVMVRLGREYEEQRDLPLEQRITWKIRVLRNEWGEKPRPGDTVKRVMHKSYFRGDGDEKRPIPVEEFETAKRNGTYEKEFCQVAEYTVDERGCISCAFQDAVYFINTFGIHYRSRKTMPGNRYEEMSRDPAPYPGGGMKHVHYWRYTEAPPDIYENLPVMRKRRTKKEIEDAANTASDASNTASQ